MHIEQIKTLAKKIQDAKSILVFGHKNPDGDSLGSVLGLYHLIADNFGKTPDVTYDGNMPAVYDFMPGRDKIIYVEKLPAKKYDLVICLDVAALKQLGDAQIEFFKNAVQTIKIDHHKTCEAFGDIDICKNDFVATAEIVYEIARELNWKIGTDAAMCLYVGIYTDTGEFSYIDNGNAFRVAAELVDLGVDARSVKPNLDVLSRNDIIAQATVLAATEFFYGGKLAVAVVPNKLYKKLDSGEVTILMRLRSVKGVRVVVVLKETKSDRITASFRSEATPVRAVAESLGGGGHDLAAAAILNASLNDAKKTVVAAFKNIL